MSYECPYCGEILDEEEAENCGDIGCPFCRRTFDWSDYPDYIDDVDAFGNNYLDDETI